MASDEKKVLVEPLYNWFSVLKKSCSLFMMLWKALWAIISLQNLPQLVVNRSKYFIIDLIFSFRFINHSHFLFLIYILWFWGISMQVTKYAQVLERETDNAVHWQFYYLFPKKRIFLFIHFIFVDNNLQNLIMYCKCTYSSTERNWKLHVKLFWSLLGD